jgi:hypothetical protein
VKIPATIVRVVRHGTTGAYDYHRCRCDRCRAAKAAYKVRWRARQQLAATDSRHGSIGAYTNYGCRCAPCRQAMTDAGVRYHAAKTAAS